jgi:hypothetical protein
VEVRKATDHVEADYGKKDRNKGQSNPTKWLIKVTISRQDNCHSKPTQDECAHREHDRRSNLKRPERSYGTQYTRQEKKVTT